MKNLKPRYQELVNMAQKAAEHAYAPYSHFQGGAAVLTHKGHIYKGCNIENSLYGLSLCAEQSAIANAIVAEGPSMKIEAIAIAFLQSDSGIPCGQCRQMIQEFGPQAKVIFPGQEDMKVESISALLPSALSFSKKG
jgi:cytidine deaminase